MRYRNSSLWNGVVGAWCPSKGPSTGPIVADLSGYNNHASLTNMDPGTDWVASENGVALDLDGTNDCIDIPVESQITTGDISVSIWVKVLTLPGGSSDGVVFHLGVSPTDRLYMAVQTSGGGNRLTCNGYNGSVQGIYGTGPVCQANVWFHYCGVVGAGTYTLYVDGIQQATASGTVITSSTATMALGDISSTGGGRGTRYLNCQLDDLLIYNRMLTPSEIAQLASRKRAAYATLPDRVYRRQTTLTNYMRRKLLLCSS